MSQSQGKAPDNVIYWFPEDNGTSFRIVATVIPRVLGIAGSVVDILGMPNDEVSTKHPEEVGGGGITRITIHWSIIRLSCYAFYCVNKHFHCCCKLFDLTIDNGWLPVGCLLRWIEYIFIRYVVTLISWAFSIYILCGTCCYIMCRTNWIASGLTFFHSRRVLSTISSTVNSPNLNICHSKL